MKYVHEHTAVALQLPLLIMCSGTHALTLALLSRHLLKVLTAASTHRAARRLRVTPAGTVHRVMLSQLLPTHDMRQLCTSSWTHNDL
jgi:hypothetical protein